MEDDLRGGSSKFMAGMYAGPGTLIHEIAPVLLSADDLPKVYSPLQSFSHAVDRWFCVMAGGL